MHYIEFPTRSDQGFEAKFYKVSPLWLISTSSAECSLTLCPRRCLTSIIKPIVDLVLDLINDVETEWIYQRDG